MEIFKLNDEIRGLSWEVNAPKGIIVISHGMSEHASRYDRFAQALNKHNYSVYAIDHIGHGVPPLHSKGHWEKGDFNKCVSNINELINSLHKKFTGKIILFGHSMGSFVAQEYLTQYGNNISGCVLSGTGGPRAITKIGKMMAYLTGIFIKGDKPNMIMNAMTFSSYNNAFKPTKTPFDWLSRDEIEVQKYINDEDCGFCCTASYFKEFLSSLDKLHKKDKLKNIPIDLPILITAGDKDPVGASYGGTEVLYNLYQKIGLKNVEHKLYEGGRHEMLNEINRDEVTKDIIAFFDKIK